MKRIAGLLIAIALWLASPQGTLAKSYPWSGGRPITVTIDLERPVAAISPRHFGHNLAWWDIGEWLARPGIARRVKAGGFKFLRFPGGSSSDEYFWDLDYGNYSQWSDRHEPWAVDLDEFLEFCRKTGAEPILTVNYGLARLESVEVAADLAARWVEYVNVERGLDVKFWEVGNELYGDWETGHHVPGKPELTGDAYGYDFIEIAEAMKAVDPTIWVGATAAEVDGAYNFWNRSMFPVVQNAADYLVVHNYFLWPFTGPGGSYVEPTPQELFGNVSEVGRMKRRVASMERRYTQRNEPWPLAFTEFNIILANSTPTIGLINGLFTAEVLGEVIKHGYIASNIWDIKNGWELPGGDHGMFAFHDPATPNNTPRSSFYAYVIYKKVFKGVMIEAKTEGAGVRAYASWDADSRTLGIVLINERERPAEVAIELPALRGKQRAWVFEGPELYGATMRFNKKRGPEGGGPFPIPHRRGLNLDLSSGKLGLAAASVTGVKLELQ